MTRIYDLTTDSADTAVLEPPRSGPGGGVPSGPPSLDAVSDKIRDLSEIGAGRELERRRNGSGE